MTKFRNCCSRKPVQKGKYTPLYGLLRLTISLKGFTKTRSEGTLVKNPVQHYAAASVLTDYKQQFERILFSGTLWEPQIEFINCWSCASLFTRPTTSTLRAHSLLSSYGDLLKLNLANSANNKLIYLQLHAYIGNKISSLTL